MNRIVVIGSCNMDIVVLADKRPAAGETIMGNELHIAHGGKGANQAVAAARLGAEVTMVGCIGQDAYGQMILDNLKENHINTDYIVTVPDTTTGTAHITLAEGDNSIIVIAGANAKVDQSVVDNAWPAIEQSDLVMVQNEIPIPTIEYIVGSKGVGYADNGEIHTVSGFKVKPVDTTGAGDTFNGAFATAIVNGKSLADALHYGNAAAALSIQKLGAQSGMPTKDEVDAFLSDK